MAQTTAVAPGTRQDTIALTRGVPAPEVLPAELLAECFAGVLRRDPVGVLQYGQPAGYLPLRDDLARRYGVTRDQIFVTNGSLQLMDLLAAHLVEPGQTVLVEQPSYDRAILTFRRRGATVIGIPLQEDGLDLDRFEEQVRRQVPAFVYLIPDFQNPSGTTLSEAKRRRLVAAAERFGFWLIEDVPYRLLRYRGTAAPTLREIGPERVILMSSYSKLIAPALRVGHLVAPPPIVAALARLGEDTYLSPVHPTQAAVAEFLRRGLLEPNVERLKALYEPRRAAMAAAVRRYLPGLPFAEPDGGFFMSLTLPPHARTERLLERAAQAGVLLTDGRSFFADPLPGETVPGDRFVRLPFCALTPQQIDAAVERLARVV